MFYEIQNIAKDVIGQIIKCLSLLIDHLSLLAYLSDSISSKTSPTLTGPFTFLIKCLFSASLPEMSVTFT